MSTTGTNTFTLTRDDVINASLRTLGVIGVGESPVSEDLTNCSQALNILIKSWVKDGIPLWVTQDISVPCVTGQDTYSLGPTGDIVMSRPMRIVDAFIRDSNNLDTTLIQISRQEYDVLGNKFSQGIPNQFYYDNQIPNGNLILYNVPVDSTRTIHIQIQRQFYDMTNGTDNFDFPSEWFQALKWGLIAEVAAEYGANVQIIPYYEQKAMQFKQECFGYSQEEASIFFTPNPQMTVRKYP